MLTILLVSATLVIACVVFHGFALQFAAIKLFRSKEFSFYRISILIALAVLAHLAEIVLFQIAYIWLVPLDQHGAIVWTTVFPIVCQHGSRAATLTDGTGLDMDMAEWQRQGVS